LLVLRSQVFCFSIYRAQAEQLGNKS
jgi:hypothetical protein